MNRAGGGIGTSLPNNVTSGIANISLSPEKKDNQSIGPDSMGLMFSPKPRSIQRTDFYPEGTLAFNDDLKKNPTKSSDLNEYYSFNSPLRKQRIMNHYLNAVKLKAHTK